MGRRIVAVIAALLITAAAAVAQAGGPTPPDPRVNGGAPRPPETRHPEGRGEHERGDRRQPTRVVFFPTVTTIVQRQCVTPGYWAYQWVPQTYTYNAWIEAQYAPDGAWVDGHYEPRYYASGYYQPYWVEGYADAC
jgi:hypothetical protein